MEGLKDLPDITLINKVKEEGCSESFNELSRRHSNLYYKICYFYFKTFSLLNCSLKDILEEKDIILFEAILKFDINKKTLFSTWLGNYTRWFCLNKINKVKKMPKIEGEEEITTAFDTKAVQNFETKRPQVNFDKILEILDSTNDTLVTNIFRLRYDPEQRKKRTWAKIASTLNLTIPRTIQLHKKGLKLLKEEIEQKKLDIFQDF